MDLAWQLLFVLFGIISIMVLLLFPMIYYKFKNLRQHPAGIFTCISICEAVAAYLLIIPHLSDNIETMMDGTFLTETARLLF